MGFENPIFRQKNTQKNKKLGAWFFLREPTKYYINRTFFTSINF